MVDQTERRTQVAAAARAVIARDGLEGASVRRVAAEAGSSTTVVTHYFADKDALLLAAVGWSGRLIRRFQHSHRARTRRRIRGKGRQRCHRHEKDAN